MTTDNNTQHYSDTNAASGHGQTAEPGPLLKMYRNRLGLTQKQLADEIKTDKRTVLNWENGNTTPDAIALKKLLAVYVSKNAITPGRELEEAAALWASVKNYKEGRASASFQYPLFDKGWFIALLTQQQAIHQNLEGQKPASTKVSTEREQVAFYGREQELTQLQGWLRNEKVKILAVRGAAGVGKTALAHQLIRQVTPLFDGVLWQALDEVTSFEDVLRQWLGQLDNAAGKVSAPPTFASENLLQCFVQTVSKGRHLLVLDQFEAALQEGEHFGEFRAEFRTCKRWLQMLSHNITLLLVGRELPLYLDTRVVGSKLSSKQATPLVQLTSPSSEACLRLLGNWSLVGNETDRQKLIELYAGNPLFLQFAAMAVQRLYRSDLNRFLKDIAEGEQVIFGPMARILKEQYERLGEVEKTVAQVLAQAVQPLTVSEMNQIASPKANRLLIIEGLFYLEQRALVQVQTKSIGETIFSLDELFAQFIKSESN